MVINVNFNGAKLFPPGGTVLLNKFIVVLRRLKIIKPLGDAYALTFFLNEFKNKDSIN